MKLAETINAIANNEDAKKAFNSACKELNIPLTFDQCNEAYFSKLANYKVVSEKLAMGIEEIMARVKSGKSIAGVIGMDELSKKAHGEVFTPPSLVDDMLNKLPKEVWSDPKLKWLDNSCGTGIFLWHGLIPRLMAGLSKKIPNEEKRRAHVAGMIYGVDIQLINVGITRSYLVKMLGSENLKTIKKQVVCHDSLTFDYWGGMKFDILVGNPPYQASSTAKHAAGGGHTLWDEFVMLALTKLLVKKGFLVYVHPCGWRNAVGSYVNVKNKMLEKQIHYLEIHDVKDGKKTFNAGTRYDWYVIENTPVYTETSILDETSKTWHMVLAKMPFIPNAMFDDVNKLLAKPGEEVVNILADSSYHTSRDFISKEMQGEFRYQIIDTIKVSGPSLRYSSKLNSKNEHFIPKIVFSRGQSQTFVDSKGEYGITENARAIVDSPALLKKIDKALNNPEFLKISNSCCFVSSGQFVDRYNKDVLRLFRKDFWKEFI